MDIFFTVSYFFFTAIAVSYCYTGLYRCFYIWVCITTAYLCDCVLVLIIFSMCFFVFANIQSTRQDLRLFLKLAYNK